MKYILMVIAIAGGLWWWQIKQGNAAAVEAWAKVTNVIAPSESTGTGSEKITMFNVKDKAKEAVSQANAASAEHAKMLDDIDAQANGGKRK